jgi:hypothetical protein
VRSAVETAVTAGGIEMTARRVVGVLAVVLTQAVVKVAPANALPDCNTTFHLVLGAKATLNPTSGINGTASAIHIPSSVTLNSQPQSASDIVLFGSDNDTFVQFGWYVGYNSTGLPFTSTPKLFFGQGNSVSETTTPINVSVAPGSLHTFSMRRSETVASPNYKKVVAFLDGVAVFVSGAQHNFTSNSSRVVAETNYLCAEMTLDASEDVGPPYRTLRYHTESGGYLYWVEHWNTGTPPSPFGACWVNGRFNSEGATAFIYGPTC